MSEISLDRRTCAGRDSDFPDDAIRVPLADENV